MPDDDGGGKSILGDPDKKVAGLPQPVVIGGLVLVGAALVFWWLKRRKKTGSTTASATTVITGSSSTGIDNAMLEAMLKDWQQHPGTTSSSTAASGTGTGSGGGGGGGQGTSSPVTQPPATPTGPNTSSTTNESGNMHGISLAQATYLFDTGNLPYVFDTATNSFVRWQGSPQAGQVYYAGPLNWQVNLQNGNVTGGTAGHPTYAVAPKPAAKPAPKPAAKKPAPKPAAKK